VPAIARFRLARGRRGSVLPAAGRRRLDPRVHVQHAHLAQEQHFVDQPLGDDHRLPVHLTELVGRVPAETVVVVGHRKFGRVAAHAAQYLRFVKFGGAGTTRVPVHRRLWLRRSGGRPVLYRRHVQQPSPSFGSFDAISAATAATSAATTVQYGLQVTANGRAGLLVLRFGGTRILVLGPGTVIDVLVHQYVLCL